MGTEGDDENRGGVPVQVNLYQLFNPALLDVALCVEKTVTGNADLATTPRVTYTIQGDGGNITLPYLPPAPSGPLGTITLTPLAIRTFICVATFKGGSPITI